jgi:hypothetical protein
MTRNVNRREFLKLTGAAGAALVANASVLGRIAPGVDAQSPEIVEYAIHPAIGIARVGNSPESFIAPELPGEAPFAPGGFKDASGAIKRQAVRFRIYGYNAAKVPVREITAADAEIRWSVHVANRKAAWYEFSTAMDIPAAEPARLRNIKYEGSARQDLVIDPGERTISGINVEGVLFDGGTFLGERIDLGDLSTDGHGRLIVKGAMGNAFNPTGNDLTTFANNTGWCDDIADGPVRATIRIDGQDIQAKSAWVASTPPNYGPSILTGFTTMYDVAEGVMIDKGWLRQGEVSFTAHVLPLFLRIADMQWVNEGAFERFGFGAREDLEDPSLLVQLADANKANRAFRTQWFDRFRNPEFLEKQPDLLPPMYGDHIAVPADTPRQWLAPTPLQYSRLEQWALGNFESDFDPEMTAPVSLTDLPGVEQAAALDRAALEPVMGGAFHPGTELTWIFRSPVLYGDVFRLNALTSDDTARQDFGSMLTPAKATAEDGPLAISGPGDITKWMATPWQTDTASCRSGYEEEVDPYLPTFWPARAPNDVLSSSQYETLMEMGEPIEVRENAFAQRVQWLRHISRPQTLESLTQMIEKWPLLGMVSIAPGPGDDVAPEFVKIETEVGFSEEHPVHDAAPSLSFRSAVSKKRSD